VSIWTYAQQSREIGILKYNGRECLFCRAAMVELIRVMSWTQADTTPA
jgi:hypothetical protein